MKKYSKFQILRVALLALLAVFSSCKKEGSRTINPEFARYIAAFSYGSVSSSSSIQIELTQDIPAVELNKEIDQELFEFSPAIKGKAYWTSTRNIKFVPEPGELKNGTEYHAWFKLDKLIQVEKDFEEFYFYFKVPEQNFNVDVLPYSPTRSNDLVWNSVEGTLSLADEAPLDKIQQMLSVSGSKTAKISVAQTEWKGRYKFTIDSLQRLDKDVKYTLEVNGSPIEAKREAEKIEIKIPKIGGNTFSVVDVRTTNEPQECIRITFSDPLSLNQNIQGLVSPNGIDNFSYDIQKNVLKLYIQDSSDSESGSSNSSSGKNISLMIYKELKNLNGKPLDKQYTYELSLEKSKPEVKLLNAGNILPNASQLNIPFQAINLWAVDVKIIKIFENNILGYLQTNDFGDGNELRRFGRLVLQKRIRLDDDHSLRLDQWNTFNLDLSTMIKQDPGAIYRVELTMKKDYSLYPCDGVVPPIPDGSGLERFDNNVSEEEEAKWDIPETYYYDEWDWDEYRWSERNNPCTSSYYVNKKTQCVVLSSNVGIIAKIGSNKQVNVALTDILTTEPISGAVVDVYNFQMQRIGTGKSDGDGFATVDYKGGVPFAVIVSHKDEKGYLKLTSNLSLSLSNFDTSGKEIKKGLKGYIYGERGVWRPGDDIYLTFILDDKDKTLPKDHPVSLELFTPQGQLYNKSVQTSTNGFYLFKLKTDPNAQTGNWRANIKVGGTSFTKTVKIETVKPNRLKVRLNVGNMLDASKESFNATLSSQWLHGAPASNLLAKVEMSLSRVATPFKGYEKYSFNNPIINFSSETYDLYNGRLDASGNANVTARLPQALSAPGMLRANIISRVFESGGDASIYAQTVPYSPYSAYVGVKTPATSDYDMLETDRNNPIEIVTLDANGKSINRQDLNVKVYKLKWSWWWNRNNEDLASYVNSTSAEVVLEKNVSTVNGKAKVDLNIKYPEYGRYLILVKDKGGHMSGKTVYVDWPYWRGRADREDASGATMLSFSMDKKTYNVGEKATVILPKSSNGRALISIENGSKVIHREWVKTSSEGDTKHTFEVTEEMNPNFYVFATLLQPHEQTNNGSPIRMYGVLNVEVENKNTILTPIITMPNELRPEKAFSVTVSEKNKKRMTYTLAIVDEGLLDLTSFKTPNAWDDFYSRQALGVRTWDMFDMVVGASTGKLGPLLSIGGDEALKPSSNPMNRFKPVVEFLGPFTLDKGGSQKHDIKLPSYIGSVRVMVVAGSEDGAYGNAEKTVPVKNPLMVLSTLPRVAGPDEDILLPVNVFATEKKVKNVSVTVKSTNRLLNLVDGSTKSVTFNEPGDKTVYFKLKASRKLGGEKIVIKATGGGEVSTETIEIEVRNPNPPIVLTSQALVSSGEMKELNLFMESPQVGDWARLEVSRMPSVDLSKNMAYLFDYPHGCSEQVTSKAFPMLFVDAFMKFSDAQKDKMKYNINEAIKIITARQLSDGGIAYWPGDHYPTEWVTTYAGHFLLEAKKKGYNVPESVIKKWVQFQKKSAQTWNQSELYNSYYSYSMNDLQQAYRLYTLALANEAELGAMNRLKEMKGTSPQSRWRLAAAYAVAGKQNAANQVIANVTDQIEDYSVSNNTYGSSYRDDAMIMETQLLLGKTEQALRLARRVSENLSSSYVSTQTASFGLMAMAKLSQKMKKGVVSYEWELNGVPQKIVNNGQLFQEINIKPQSEIEVKFTNKGQGELYVRLIGYTRPLVTEYDMQRGGLRIYVRYLDASGQELNVSSLRQGTEFFADVVVQNSSGEYLTDLALTQVFPSGWEIFNSRLFNEGAGSASNINYQDIRDDRVMTYFNLRDGYSTSFRVRLQAAYCGRFYLPATICEAMYKPEEQARVKGQWVEVKQ